MIGDPLNVGPLPAKFDRIYKARGADDTIYEVNVARLECSCPEWREHRAGFPAGDARRVCSHVLEKCYTTKVEKSFSLLVQLYIRYGRTMRDCVVVEDRGEVFVIGQPFGAGSIRAISVVNSQPVLATYNFSSGGYWSGSESDISEDLAARILKLMRAAMPQAFH